jgi:hypothetical protein
MISGILAGWPRLLATGVAKPHEVNKNHLGDHTKTMILGGS